MPDAARDQILEYMVHPLVLRGLYNLYATPFLETMLWPPKAGARPARPGPGDGAPGHGQRRDPGHVPGLLLPALPLRPSLEVSAGNARARELAGAYLETDERVQKANIAFQSALRLQEPEDPKAQKETMVAGDMLKQAIRARDEVKRALIEIVRTECGAPCREVETSEILAVSLWLQRRDMDKAVVASALTASELLSDLSSKMRRKAGEI